MTPSPPQPATDIIIVNYRCADDTLTAVATIGEWPHGRILLVDNSRDAAEADRLRAALAGKTGIELIVPEDNLGFGRGCNLAFAQSSADFVLLLNPDARIEQESLQILIRTLQEDSRLGAVSPRTYWDMSRRFMLPSAFAPTPAMTLAMTLAPSWRTLTKRLALRYVQRQRACMASSRPYDTGFLVGALMLVRRSAVLAAGGLFDDVYFMFYEDSDLSLRLRRAGFRLGIVPQAEAVHEYRHKSYKAALMSASCQIYFARNFPVFHRLTSGLSRLSRWGPAVRWEDWGELLPAVSSAEELHMQLGSREGVLALSPSPMLLPALFRPAGLAPVQLNAEEWALLEPGRYMLLCGPLADSSSFIPADRADSRMRWVSFEKH